MLQIQIVGTMPKEMLGKTSNSSGSDGGIVSFRLGLMLD